MSNKDDFELIPKLSGDVTPDGKLDKKRIFSSSQKNQIWDNAKKAVDFDPTQFRYDMSGCLVSNLFVYNKNVTSNEYQKMLSLEYEHIIPHSKCGATTTKNGALLNAFFNRSKSDTELSKLNQKVIDGIRHVKGISAKRLAEQLVENPHQICSQFDLYFLYDTGNKYWYIQETYYNDQHLFYSGNIKIRDNKDLTIFLTMTATVLYNVGKNAAYITIEFIVEPIISQINDLYAKDEKRFLLEEEAEKAIKRKKEYEENKETGYVIAGVLSMLAGISYIAYKLCSDEKE